MSQGRGLPVRDFQIYYCLQHDSTANPALLAQRTSMHDTHLCSPYHSNPTQLIPALFACRSLRARAPCVL